MGAAPKPSLTLLWSDHRDERLALPAQIIGEVAPPGGIEMPAYRPDKVAQALVERPARARACSAVPRRMLVLAVHPEDRRQIRRPTSPSRVRSYARRRAKAARSSRPAADRPAGADGAALSHLGTEPPGGGAGWASRCLRSGSATASIARGQAQHCCGSAQSWIRPAGRGPSAVQLRDVRSLACSRSYGVRIITWPDLGGRGPSRRADLKTRAGRSWSATSAWKPSDWASDGQTRCAGSLPWRDSDAKTRIRGKQQVSEP
jgi:hypothetical protein